MEEYWHIWITSSGIPIWAYDSESSSDDESIGELSTQVDDPKSGSENNEDSPSMNTIELSARSQELTVIGINEQRADQVSFYHEYNWIAWYNIAYIIAYI